MDYEKVFDVAELQAARAPEDRDVYVYDDQIELAVNVALVTGRPLLVAGDPGSGKSSLAPSVAALLGRRFYRKVVSSRTEARDLLWTFDALARLRAAQAGVDTAELDMKRFVRPGVLWNAFDQESARAFAPDPQAGEAAVVLLDEIDKADPDVPNDLLVPLGDYLVVVTDAEDLEVTAKEPRPLVVLTTNDERELPAAFTRRCVVLVLESPGRKRYRAIAASHFPDGDKALHAELAILLESLATQAVEQHVPPPSSAEYLDAIQSCQRLGVGLGHEAWKTIASATLTKRRELSLST